MSRATPDTESALVPTLPRGAALWRRQVLAILGLELRKTFLRWRALPVWILAFSPAAILALRAIAFSFEDPDFRHGTSAENAARIYATMFQTFYMRFVLFFGCVAIFTYLFRGELLERSLHFYLLAPMRRSVLLVGKYLTGLVAAWAVFGASTVLQLAFGFLTPATTGGTQYLLAGPGTGHALAYLGITALACVGYGAVFLVCGLYFRNPMIPAATVLGWEMLNFLLPPALKKISVVHYLQSLCPIPISQGPFALPAEPTPAPLAVLGLLALAGALVALAVRRAERLEVTYAGD